MVASDLDRTLIYSPSALELPEEGGRVKRLSCVEIFKGTPHSFMTERSAANIATLNKAGVLMPVTTRTVEQFLRIELPGPASKFALCANGGRLLRDGVEDLDFSAAVTARLAESGAPHGEMLSKLRRVSVPTCGDKFVENVRDASGLFCYAVVERKHLPAGWVQELTEFAQERAWTVSVQGRKVYLVPTALSKAAAAREVADMLGAPRLLAAGDSLLDLPLLEEADAAIRPAHGELDSVKWSPPHVVVTATAGVMAGEEMSAWMVRQAGL